MGLESTSILMVIFVTFLPTAELRVGIPLGLTLGLDLPLILLCTILANTAVFFPAFFMVDIIYDKWLSKRKIAVRWVEYNTRKLRRLVDKYGFIGLALFVAIPLPLTGAWTGSIIARLLGFDWKKSLVCVSLGVGGAAAIVTFLTLQTILLFNL